MRNVLIVIEGVDRTGKTELATGLADQCGGQVIHAGIPGADPEQEYAAPLLAWDRRRPLILDRWHMGEMVWPKIFGRSTTFDMDAYKRIDAIVSRLGGIVVYAQRQDTAIHKAELFEYQEPILPTDLKYALELYEGIILETVTPVHRYDASHNTASQVLGVARRLETM